MRRLRRGHAGCSLWLVLCYVHVHVIHFDRNRLFDYWEAGGRGRIMMTKSARRLERPSSLLRRRPFWYLSPRPVSTRGHFVASCLLSVRSIRSPDNGDHV